MELADILFIIIFWVFWYGSMLLLGYFLESRIVPLWKHQSKAYFPGDLALPIMLVGVFREYRRDLVFPRWVCSPIFAIITGIFIIIMAYIWVSTDRKNYPYRATISPTKRWHDTVGYYIYPLIMIEGALPIIVGWISGNFVPESLDIGLFVGGLAFYVAMVVVDIVFLPATKEDIYIRHPYDWKLRR